MAENNEEAFDSTVLRNQAKARLEENRDRPQLGTVEESRMLNHELMVHKIELELQNAELRHARDELEKALGNYTDLYDFAPVGYFTLDRLGTIRSVNLTSAGLVGIERSLLVGRRIGLFILDEDQLAFADFLEKVFTSSVNQACEVSLLKEGNAPLCVQVEGVTVASGQECRIALIDITERKRVEEALRLDKEAAEALLVEKEAATAIKLEKEAVKVLRLAKDTAEALLLAEKSSKALRMKEEIEKKLRQEKEAIETNAKFKNQFFINMSHELRTPMTGILGMLQLALEEDELPVLRNYLETAQSSARALLRILNDILDMAKLEAGKLIIEEEPFSLKKCIAEAVNIVASEVRRKKLDFTVSVAEDVPDTVVGDQMRLRQVLINLFGNSIKFTERGEVELRVIAGKAISDGKRQFTFGISDTGIGIPDDKRKFLFQAFSQVDSSLSRSFGGTGLGLTISRNIVELIGGKIFFVSEEGVGSTFSFTIPLGEAALDSYTLPASELSESTTTVQVGQKGSRILLAEDDLVSRLVITKMLKKSNYNVDVAEDGQKAIEMWEKGGYDLVLMDVQMPRLNGFEATHVIREKEQEHGSHTPIIAMTAHAGKEHEEICLAAGMDSYISKPIDFKQCLQKIGDILRQSAMP